MADSVVRIGLVLPDVMGTYGDGGNGLILARRAQWRGVDVELLQAVSDAPVPEADIYCLGGGEDGPQVRAARTLIDDGTLARRVAGGAVVLAVCAGFQVVGRSFPGASGEASLAIPDLVTQAYRLQSRVNSIAASSGDQSITSAF